MLRIVGWIIIFLLLLTVIIGGWYYVRSFIPGSTVSETSGLTRDTPGGWGMVWEKRELPLDIEPGKISSPTVSTTESTATVSNFFQQNGHFDEMGNMGESEMHDWWLNSGAYISIQDGIAETVQGELEKNDKRRIYYKNYNASETDDGYHPQNIFRLVTKSKWKNFRQECYFKLNRYILSEDEHRSESNGFLLFNRYQDENNLYYTGVRVDGTVVVKKKIDGEYFTLDQKAVFPGSYNRKKNPNLLPIGKWIGVRSEVTTRADGAAVIRVSVDTEASGEWQQILVVTDTGKKYGGSVIKDEGYAGIRTDFMDAAFKDYAIVELGTDGDKR